MKWPSSVPALRPGTVEILRQLSFGLGSVAQTGLFSTFPIRQFHQTYRILKTYEPGPKYRKAQEMGFTGTHHEYLSETVYARDLRKYEQAVARGFEESFDVWKLRNPVRPRLHGDLPFILTLKKTEIPPKEEMVRLMRAHNGCTRGIGRHVVIDGQNVGLAIISFGLGSKAAMPDSVWARPYFDPARKVLGFQGEDGMDLGVEKPLPYLAVKQSYRPLLRLAHAEGLIEAIPDDRLRSLDLDRVRSSGYCLSLRGDHKKSGPTYLRGNLRVGIRDELHSVTVSFNAPTPDEVWFFPYIGSDNLLHFWDVQQNRVLPRWKQERQVAGYEAEEVSRRWPVLFALAQEDGFWKDVSPPRG